MHRLIEEQLILNHGLSNRECEVALQVASGCTNKEAASSLFVTEKTIKFHLTNIFKKAGVKNRGALIVKVLNYGFKLAPSVPPTPAVAVVPTATSLPMGAVA